MPNTGMLDHRAFQPVSARKHSIVHWMGSWPDTRAGYETAAHSKRVAKFSRHLSKSFQMVSYNVLYKSPKYTVPYMFMYGAAYKGFFCMVRFFLITSTKTIINLFCDNYSFLPTQERRVSVPSRPSSASVNNSIAPFNTIMKPTCGYYFSIETDNRKRRIGIGPTDLMSWRPNTARVPRVKTAVH